MTGKNNWRPCEKGVSESIGFLLIFTIVITGIGLVTLYGYPKLLQQQTSADEQIMEKNMIVLQNDMNSRTYKTVPYKETSLKIGSGALTVYNSTYAPATSSIKIYNGSPPGYVDIIYVDNYRSGDLMFSSVSASTDISLQNGAVVMRPLAEPGSVMLASPRWFYDGQTKNMVINVVNITSTNILSRTGIGTVQMALGDTQFRIEHIPSAGFSGSTIYLEYTPDPDTPSPRELYSTAWDNYFQKTLGMQLVSGTPGTGDTLKYTLPETTTLVIKQYEVNIRSL
jgi:hypothetical protein